MPFACCLWVSSSAMIQQLLVSVLSGFAKAGKEASSVAMCSRIAKADLVSLARLALHFRAKILLRRCALTLIVSRSSNRIEMLNLTHCEARHEVFRLENSPGHLCCHGIPKDRQHASRQQCVPSTANNLAKRRCLEGSSRGSFVVAAVDADRHSAESPNFLSEGRAKYR